jgi:hypothetical protein
LELALVIAPHPLSGEAQRLDQLGGHQPVRLLELIALDADRERRGAVQPFVEADHGGVAPGAHVRDDPLHHLADAETGTKQLAVSGAHVLRRLGLFEGSTSQDAGTGLRRAVDDAH